MLAAKRVVNAAAEAAKRISSARSTMILDHKFFACLILNLTPIEMPASLVKTMATDGKHLFYNAEFTLELDDEELICIIAHEGYHCVYRHHVRMGTRDLKRWNYATDYVINYDLVRMGFKLPSWALYDPQYAGLSAEEVYEMLPADFNPPQQGPAANDNQGQPQPSQGQGNQKADNKGQGKGKGKGQGKPEQGQSSGGSGQPSQPQVKSEDPGGMGGVIPPVPVWDETGLAEENARWERIAKQAVAVSKAENAGTLPGTLERLMQDLNKPRIDWQSKLQRFIDNSISKDYAWTKPNKRFLHTGLIIPGLVPDKLQHIVAFMDTSGSVTNQLVSKYSVELQALMDEGHCDKLTVIYTDTVIQRVEEFTRGDEVKLHPKGGGGTDFTNAFKYFSRECYDASVILFFTDLIVSRWGAEPGVPVLWLVYGDSRFYEQRAKKVPFGECVHVS